MVGLFYLICGWWRWGLALPIITPKRYIGNRASLLFLFCSMALVFFLSVWKESQTICPHNLLWSVLHGMPARLKWIRMSCQGEKGAWLSGLRVTSYQRFPGRVPPTSHLMAKLLHPSWMLRSTSIAMLWSISIYRRLSSALWLSSRDVDRFNMFSPFHLYLRAIIVWGLSSFRLMRHMVIPV